MLILLKKNSEEKKIKDDESFSLSSNDKLIYINYTLLERI